MTSRHNLFLDAFSPDYRRYFGLFQPRERVSEPLRGEPLAHYEWLADALYTAALLTDASVFVPGAFVLQCPLLSRLVERNRLLVRESLLRMPIGDTDVQQDLERMRAKYPKREFPRMHTAEAETTVATVSEGAILRESQLTEGIVRIIQELPDTRQNGERWWRDVSSTDAALVIRSVERTFGRGAPLTFAAVRETAPRMPPTVQRAVFGGIQYAFGSQHVDEYGLAVLIDIPGIHDHFGIDAICPAYSYRRTWDLLRHLGLNRGLLRCAGAEGILVLRSKPVVGDVLSRFARVRRGSSSRAVKRLSPLSGPTAVSVQRLARAQSDTVLKKWSTREGQRVRATRLLDELSDVWLHILDNSGTSGGPERTDARSRLSQSAPTDTQQRHGRKNVKPRVGIVTVIGPELDAMKRALSISDDSRVSGGGHLRYEIDYANRFSGTLRLELHCVGRPGNTASALATMRAQYRGVQFMLLCGIAAGRREKVRIGDVVVPRAVVDATLKVAEGGSLFERPQSVPPLAGVLEMNAAASVDALEWAALFRTIFPDSIVPGVGEEDEYAKHVAEHPALHDVAIYSDNTLLRDPQVLIDAANSLHQQIKAGEMEAAGFIAACQDTHPPIPWFVARGISDFGDSLKNDRFHGMAASAVASYAALYLRNVLDLRIWT